MGPLNYGNACKSTVPDNVLFAIQICAVDARAFMERNRSRMILKTIVNRFRLGRSTRFAAEWGTVVRSQRVSR